jgi:hypothetical protein
MRRALAWLLFLALPVPARAQDSLQWSGFALLRATSSADSGPLQSDAVSSQVQLGVDWTPSPHWLAHLHLLGRTETDDGTRRGKIGVVEAFFEGNFRPRGDRVRIRGGAFFLPTSRENVDALWESPYTITSSALNSWLGEELRPIGIDATWFHRGFMGGATLFRGNDTLGALPAVRGWTLDDHWTLLGEWLPVAPDFTSVSAEIDGRVGWSARVGWSGATLSAQLTHLDNRNDGLPHGQLFGWGTYFDVASVELTRGDWTFIAEHGWGPTFLVVEGIRYTTKIDAGYALASHRWSKGRATVRFDRFRVDDLRTNAWTVAWLWTPPGRLRPGIELASAGGDTRAIIEVRYAFSGH